jgi:hypothetical protein
MLSNHPDSDNSQSSSVSSNNLIQQNNNLFRYLYIHYPSCYKLPFSLPTTALSDGLDDNGSLSSCEASKSFPRIQFKRNYKILQFLSLQYPTFIEESFTFHDIYGIIEKTNLGKSGNEKEKELVATRKEEERVDGDLKAQSEMLNPFLKEISNSLLFTDKNSTALFYGGGAYHVSLCFSFHLFLLTSSSYCCLSLPLT